MNRPVIRIVFSLLLMAAGGWIVCQMCLPAKNRAIPELLQAFSWLAPAAGALGLLMLLRTTGWGGRLLSRRRVLVAGAIVFVTGIGFAGILIATDPGGDASWLNGLLIMASAIFVALPGLALMVASLAIKPESR